jgi:hypothetical protein
VLVEVVPVTTKELTVGALIVNVWGVVVTVIPAEESVTVTLTAPEVAARVELTAKVMVFEVVLMLLGVINVAVPPVGVH